MPPDTRPYYIHQYIEIPEPRLDVEHIILFRALCAQCGRMVKALIPFEKRIGLAPGISADIAELCGMHGDSRRTVQGDKRKTSPAPAEAMDAAFQDQAPDVRRRTAPAAPP